MRGESVGLVIGLSIGLVVGAVMAVSTLLFIRCQKRKKTQIGNSSSSSRMSSTIPFRVNDDDDSCSVISDLGSPKIKLPTGGRSISWCVGGLKKTNVVPSSGILEYPYKDLQKGTLNFTTLIGKGAFGSVYRATLQTGVTVAVKVLSDSKGGQKEFHNEVKLLGRLHHRNLVNLVGYCAHKGQHILVYVYMSGGSLASHLYDMEGKPLSWRLRVSIAIDVARGLEYLHDGAIPPIIHRDIKSSNILLDHSMRARLADFGLSRVEVATARESNVRGTIGYIDPEYVSTRAFTKKSDVYSFGVLLFELITGRNPQQGLREHVDLAAMNAGEMVGWEEVVDSRLDGHFDLHELNDVADVAYRCIDPVSGKRPVMRDVVQRMCKALRSEQSVLMKTKFSSSIEASSDFEPRDIRILVPGYRAEGPQ